jgi:crotonobetainyl-CoA:carnitine CoA-transferase CaiB-like acyl-CoA transferase
LRKRDADGEGSICDIAMTDGVLGFAALQMATALSGDGFTRGGEMLTGGIAPYRCYLAKDGAVVTLGSLEPKFWLTFAAQSGIDADPVALLPGPHQHALQQRMAEVFAARTGAEWKAFADAHDCCVEVALSPEEIAGDPQLNARGMFFDEMRDGERVVAFRTPVSPTRPETACAPKPGEHTRVILEQAGLSSQEVDALIASGAVSESP